jgi:galactose oxidase
MRSKAASVVAILMVMCLVSLSPHDSRDARGWGSEALAAGAVGDAWGGVTTLIGDNGMYAAPIAGAILPDGRVFLLGQQRPSVTSDAGKRDWAAVITPAATGGTVTASITVPSIAIPLDAVNQVDGSYLVGDDLVCSGITLTADGHLFTAGGSRTRYNWTTGAIQVLGLSYATIFDGTTWSRVAAPMTAIAREGQPLRWYPTVTRLPDSRLLVISGADRVAPDPIVNLSTEAYDPATGVWTVVSPWGNTPVEIANADYTQAFVLPSPANGLIMFGEAGMPVLGSGSAGRGWVVLAKPRPGSEQWNSDRLAGTWNRDTAPNYGASSALLPLRINNGEWGYFNGSVVMTGGPLGTPHAQNVDVYDPLMDTWLAPVDAGIQRHHPATVLLPDGKVLVIGGHSTDPNVQRALYIDPRNGFSVAVGSDSGEVRGYHAVDLLLPDGRVLVAGGRDIVTATSIEKPTLRYYSPPYMSAVRPQIVGAPSGIGFNQYFFVDSAGAMPSEVVLIGLGSMTHSFDTNQRYVQLTTGTPASAGGGLWRTVVAGPSDGRSAPPGYYMLFVVDAHGIPSKASIVHVQ